MRYRFSVTFVIVTAVVTYFYASVTAETLCWTAPSAHCFGTSQTALVVYSCLPLIVLKKSGLLKVTVSISGWPVAETTEVSLNSSWMSNAALFSS